MRILLLLLYLVERVGLLWCNDDWTVTTTATRISRERAQWRLGPTAGACGACTGQMDGRYDLCIALLHGLCPEPVLSEAARRTAWPIALGEARSASASARENDRSRAGPRPHSAPSLSKTHTARRPSRPPNKHSRPANDPQLRSPLHTGHARSHVKHSLPALSPLGRSPLLDHPPPQRRRAPESAATCAPDLDPRRGRQASGQDSWEGGDWIGGGRGDVDLGRVEGRW